MQPSGIVSLLTDFGLKDPFVGVMKAVVLDRFRGATLVDLTHEIAPQDVRSAAFWLAASCRWFPRGTVHLAVVDPGVGSERAPVVVRAAEQCFVGPDNGLFELVRRVTGAVEVRRIAPRWALSKVSQTFHGRDVFAPIAALLASGEVRFEDVGLEQELVGQLGLPDVTFRRGWKGAPCFEGSVVLADRFGNLITNIELAEPLSPGWQAHVGHYLVHGAGTYAEVACGELLAYRGSFGQLEIAVRDGSALLSLGAEPGTLVTLEGPCP